MTKHERMENLFYKNEETGYRYLGALESCYTLFEFTTKEKEEEPYISSCMANILRRDEYEDLSEGTKDCVECEYYSSCERKDYILDDRKPCLAENFYNLDKDINQKVVFYDEQLNSAVVFSVDADVCCGNEGFETINDLLDDIYDGINSPYSEYTLDSYEEIETALKLKNNLMYIRYANAEGYVDCDVVSTFRSLEGKKIHTIVDISCLLNKGDEK